MKLYKWNVKNYLSKNKSIFVGIVKQQYLKNVWIYGIFFTRYATLSLFKWINERKNYRSELLTRIKAPSLIVQQKFVIKKFEKVLHNGVQ